MRRRGFLALGGAAGLILTGCDISLRNGVFNACHAPGLPADLRDHPLVAAAWRDIDPTMLWDVHCHVFGNGKSGSGLWFNPLMEHIWRTRRYVQREFFINAACVDDSPAKLDASYVERLLDQVRDFPAGIRLLLFAFDWARDDAGAPLLDRSTFHVAG